MIFAFKIFDAITQTNCIYQDYYPIGLDVRIGIIVLA